MAEQYTGGRKTLAEWHQDSGRTTARLVVDQEDSFFFDHALDHVPGILFIVGLLELIRTENGDIPPDRRVKTSLEFHRFCDLDDDITMSVSPLTPEVRNDGDGENEPGWNLCAKTGVELAVSGTAVLHQKPLFPLVPAAPDSPGTSLPTAELTHRSRLENCFVDKAWWAGDRLLATARKPPVGHPLGDRPLEQLIETSRQFATLLGHAGYERPIGSKFILRTLEADLPSALPTADVRLEWVPRPRKGRAFDLAMRLYHPSGDGLDAEIGSANLDVVIVDQRQYDTIRFRRHRTEESAR